MPATPAKPTSRHDEAHSSKTMAVYQDLTTSVDGAAHGRSSWSGSSSMISSTSSIS